MLTGGNKFEDPYDVFEARFFVNAKRACIAFAVIALGLGAHDLSSRSLASGAAFAAAHDNADALSAAPAASPAQPARHDTQAAAPVAQSEEPKQEAVVVAAVAASEKTSKTPTIGSAEPVAISIPPAEKPKTPAAVAADKTAAKVENSVLAELATARHLDAIEAAMASDKAMAKATPADMATLVAAPSPAASPAIPAVKLVAAPMPRSKPVQLASLNPAAPPAATITPAAKPAGILLSLPATISVLPRPAPRPRAVPLAQVSPPVAPVAVSEPAPPPTSPVTQAPAPAPTVQLASIDPEAIAFGTGPAPLVSQFTLPATIKVLPPPAPGVPPPSPAQRLHLEGEARAKAEKCLSNAIYFEARDQPYKGQVAVAQVVMNRVFSGVYPRDVCGVIYQNANRHLACQFTFACDGKRKVINERAEWARARRIARDTLDGVLYVQAVGTATHYHANYVHPNWVREMKRYAREGVHLFYRPIAWGNGADEPRWSREQKKKK